MSQANIKHGTAPKALPPRRDLEPVFIDVKSDITPEEAFALCMTILLSTKGMIPQKYSGYQICNTVESVEKIFDTAWRHFSAPTAEEKQQLDRQLNGDGEADGKQPEPHIDANGKKHYTMNCDAGKLGVTGGELKGKKSGT